MEYKPKYSGPGKSGICKCGHSWQDHHLMLVMRQEYVAATGEGYGVGACQRHGVNEAEGMMYDENGMLVDHCFGYEDRGELST